MSTPTSSSENQFSAGLSQRPSAKGVACFVENAPEERASLSLKEAFARYLTQCDISSEAVETLTDDLLAVKARMQALVPPDALWISESLDYVLTTPGKMLRPLLTLLVGQGCLATAASPTAIDPQLKRILIETAAVSEMIHLATLLHDDVLDDADLRRGKATVRSQWGNTVSILSGDYLLAQSSLKLAEIGNIELVRVFSSVLSDLCDGEVEQLRTRYTLEATTWDVYYRKTMCKTASLFSAACEAAGIIARQPMPVIEHLKTFGQEFGIVFQIVDDLLDYTANEKTLGKPVLDDLRQGLINAPMLLMLDAQHSSPEDIEWLQQKITQLFQLAQPEASAAVSVESAPSVQALAQDIQTIMLTKGLIEKTQALAHQHVQRAYTALTQAMPETQERQLLMTLLQHAVSREK